MDSSGYIYRPATLTLTATAGCVSSPSSASFTVTVAENLLQHLVILVLHIVQMNLIPFDIQWRRSSRHFFIDFRINLCKHFDRSGQLRPSAAGTYTVTNTIAAAGGCGVITATSLITITKLLVATFNYATSPYCSNEANPSPTFIGGGVAGTFSSTAGLFFLNTLTGQVNLAASTAGTYTVTNTIAAVGGCGIVSANSSITITTLPAATIFYTGSPWCGSAGVQNVTFVGHSGGTYSAVPSGLSIDPLTGAITTSTSTAATYTVIYTIPASGGCGAATTTTSVTISPTPTAPVIGTITQTTCSVATGSVVLNSLPATGAWTLIREPGRVTTLGTGTTTTISGLPSRVLYFYCH